MSNPCEIKCLGLCYLLNNCVPTFTIHIIYREERKLTVLNFRYSNQILLYTQPRINKTTVDSPLVSGFLISALQIGDRSSQITNFRSKERHRSRKNDEE